MDKKWKIIIAVAAVLIILYYTFIKGKKEAPTKEEVLDNSMAEASNNMSNLYRSNQRAVDETMYSQADLDYNDAVRRYQLKYKTQPDRSWTTDEIEERIKDYDKIQALIATYLELEYKYDEGNQIKTEKELGRMNASELQILVQNIENQNRRTVWNRRKKEIEVIVNAFHDNFTNVGTWLGDCKGYDVGTFQQLVALKPNERVYANLYFATLDPVNVGSSWRIICQHPTKASSISGAIPTLGDSVDRDRAQHSSAGKAEAMKWSKKVKEEYALVSGSVNEYGEIAGQSSTGSSISKNTLLGGGLEFPNFSSVFKTLV